MSHRDDWKEKSWEDDEERKTAEECEHQGKNSRAL